MSDVRVNRRGLEELEDNPQVRDALADLGSQVAKRAATMAPKRPGSGAGARSIHAEVGKDDRGPWVRVSWDKNHFYMGFHELGTSKMSARPFLRPALDGTYR